MDIKGNVPYRKATIPYRKSAGVAYVIIPQGVDRDEYVRFAVASNTVCLLSTKGDYIRNVAVASPYSGNRDGIMSTMEFPPNSNQMGSMVVYVTLPDTSMPVVVGAIQQKGQAGVLTEEEQTVVTRVSYKEDGSKVYFRIDGKGKSGDLRMSASNKVSLLSENEFEVNTSILNLYAETVNYEFKNWNVYVIDNKLEEIKGKWSMICENINLGEEDAKEAAVLGDTLKSVMSELIDELRDATIELSSHTHQGIIPTTPPLTVAKITPIIGQIAATKAKFSTFLSKLVKLS